MSKKIEQQLIKEKVEKMWCVLFTGELAIGGWGTMQSWVFKYKYEAEDEVKSIIKDMVWDKNDVKIVRCEVRYKK